MIRKQLIEGYENYYITSKGVVFNTNYHSKGITQKLKFDNSKKNKRGQSYLRVTLSKHSKTKRFQVHRLVAKAFIPNPENKPCVNHIDGNPSNNNVNNLEWCTYSENELHSYKVLQKQPTRIWKKLKPTDIPKIFKLRKKGLLQREIADKFKVSREHIRDILNKKRCSPYNE